jgi:hypothetical protein
MLSTAARGIVNETSGFDRNFVSVALPTAAGAAAPQIISCGGALRARHPRAVRLAISDPLPEHLESCLSPAVIPLMSVKNSIRSSAKLRAKRWTALASNRFAVASPWRLDYDLSGPHSSLCNLTPSSMRRSIGSEQPLNQRM